MIVSSYYKKGTEPTQTISPPQFDYIDNVELLLIGNTMNVSFKKNEFDLEFEPSSHLEFDYTKVYGDFEYVIEITNMLNETSTHTSTSSNFSFTLMYDGKLKIKAYTRYANIKNLTSNIYESEYYSLFTF